MASVAAFSNQNLVDTQFSTPVFRPSSRRSPSLASFSSSSSASSFASFSSQEDYFSTPQTPLRYSGIPFSWEQLPGIPKKDTESGSRSEKSSLDQNDSSQILLPLPPAGNSSYSKKRTDEISPRKSTSESFRKDPFFTALVECSKDDDRDTDSYWRGSKVTRTLSDRIGFVNMYTSCKRTCEVSESTVYLPRSRTYNLLRRR